MGISVFAFSLFLFLNLEAAGLESCTKEACAIVII